MLRRVANGLVENASAKKPLGFWGIRKIMGFFGSFSFETEMVLPFTRFYRKTSQSGPLFLESLLLSKAFCQSTQIPPGNAVI